ncbi:tectonic-1 [Gracilinanus agilis]|uniref:tectonic-1 n=1 Tax=Gracilinanus agilis TaxID=191870 RepID=UPI001CFD7EC2|nr:tectonic-1 [Gracilinanus agilis]
MGSRGLLVLLLLLLAGTPRDDPPVTEALEPAELVWSSKRPTPVTDVSSLCVCDLLVEECDINCCCDPDCSPTDFSIFSKCSVPFVKENNNFCIQKVAVYSINFTAYPPQRIFKVIEQSNPSFFCISTLNYKLAFSFITPKFPNENNFDNFMRHSANFVGNKGSDIFHPTVLGTKYKYGVPLQTSDSFLKLPSPSVSIECVDNNPIGFLMDQTVECSRIITLEQCSKIKALHMDHYTQPKILAVPNSHKEINIIVQSIFMRSLNKTLSQLALNDVPVEPTFTQVDGREVCTNVVLKAKYSIIYTVAGEITGANLHLHLGVVSSTMLPIQQQFQVSFIQENAKPSLHLSGNPGYITGLPLLAGFYKDSGVIQSSNRYRQFTILQNTAGQDCLAAEGIRTPILFGYNMISGCSLILPINTKCQQLVEKMTNLLKGQNFPEFVFSFGNSLAQNSREWVPVQFTTEILEKKDLCVIPVALDIKVSWTKFGSLVNPQAKIVSVSAKMTSSSIPQSYSRNKVVTHVTTVVRFVDVSAPAKAGYRAQPTIDARLPSNFFFPFV